MLLGEHTWWCQHEGNKVKHSLCTSLYRKLDNTSKQQPVDKDKTIQSGVRLGTV